MENFSIDLTPAMFKIIFCIAALIQMIKRIPVMASHSNWFPLVSCALGIAGAFLAGIADPVFSGILMGTIASGSYSLLKSGIVTPTESAVNLGASLTALDKQLTEEKTAIENQQKEKQ
jgi:hypothetical protein